MTERDETGAIERLDESEVDEADAVEQRTDAAEHAYDDDPADHDTAEADEADVAEQSRAVDVDDDDYR